MKTKEYEETQEKQKDSVSEIRSKIIDKRRPWEEKNVEEKKKLNARKRKREKEKKRRKNTIKKGKRCSTKIRILGWSEFDMKAINNFLYQNPLHVTYSANIFLDAEDCTATMARVYFNV